MDMLRYGHAAGFFNCTKFLSHIFNILLTLGRDCGAEGIEKCP